MILLRIGMAAALWYVTASAEPAAAQAAAGATPTLAVLDLRDGGSMGPEAADLSNLGVGIATMLTTEMTRNPRVEMVERDRLQQLINEQKLTLSGLADAATAVQVGKLLGAHYMLFGSYTDVWSNLRIDVRVVEVETGRVRRAQEVTDKRDRLFQSVTRLAEQMFRDLDLAPPASAPSAAAASPVPAKAVVMFSQGIGFEDRGDQEKAKEMYRKALELAPDYRDARQRLDRLEGGL